MRTYKILFAIIVTLVSFLLINKFISLKEEKVTIILKIKDEIQIVGGNNFPVKSVNFPIEYFKMQEAIKNSYVNSTTKLSLNADISFIKALTNSSLSESKYSFIPFISSTIIKIDSIVPLFSNYDDVLQVMSGAAVNNNRGKYMFTNLFNYIKIEVRVNKTGKEVIEKIIQSFLFTTNFNTKLFNKQKIIEYFYYPGIVSAATTTGVGTSPSISNYRDVLGISTTPTWGTGGSINIIDFDEGVSKPSSTNWRFTEFPIDPSTHGDKVMSVLFGGVCSIGTKTETLIGLIPNATAEVVSYKNNVPNVVPQYGQFLHALRKSLENRSTGRIKSRILLIEVHNQAVNKDNPQLLPLECDPAMFFLTRLGAFGLKLIIIEASGNGKINLNTFADTFFNFTNPLGIPLSEFNSLIARSRISSNIEATPLQIDNTTATTEEISSNSRFNYTSITGTSTPTSWLSIWRSSPSGAIIIAGYEPSTNKCRTNYGSKVKIIGPGNNVKSLKFSSPCSIDSNFNGSSAASAVVTGIIASALSKDTSLTEGDIKNGLFNHTTPRLVIVPPPPRSSRGTPACTLKVPNVTNLYSKLGIYP